ncbi:MAG: leucine-rich repeat domain-containing protein [Candidatus Hodarchaeota archaeon]
MYLDGNKISKIEGLENNPKLVTLYLGNNNISKIEGLEKISNLWNLFLYGGERNSGILIPILEHNFCDLLSLVRIYGHLILEISRPI